MPIDDREWDTRARGGATALLARAADADLRATDRLQGAIDDAFLSDAARLDDRTRLGIAAVLTDLVDAAIASVRVHAVRLLIARDGGALAERMTTESAGVLARLRTTGLLREPALMREVVGQVRQDGMAAMLPAVTPDDPDAASLLPRLLHHADPVVGTAVAGLLAAESDRRIGRPAGAPPVSNLPAKLHQQLVWWCTAALREPVAASAGAALPTLDRALAEAAARSIAAHDDTGRLEEAALRLARALDPTPPERAALLVEALLDRRLALFIAVIAEGLGIEYADARDAVLDPNAERLWLILRALDVGRGAIARIGLSLSEADPRRDVEGFVEMLDDMLAIPPLAAREALTPLLLHPAYRAAVTALAQGRRRATVIGDWQG